MIRRDQLYSMKVIYFFVILLFFFLSCKTTEPPKQKPSYASGLENIKHNLDKDKIDLFDAYTHTLKLQKKYKEGTKDFDNANAYLEELILSMNKKAEEENAEGNYNDALRYVLSLKVLRKESTIALNDIYKKLSEHADRSSDIFTQNTIKEEMADLKLMSDKELFNFLKMHALRKSRGVYLNYFDKYSQMYPDITNKYLELKTLKNEMESLSDLNIEELMNSVVAVILNKGMNIKDGMGYFDKTIGTGFFIDNDGYILTNHHVIADHVDPTYEGYSMVYVTTKDEPDIEIPAKVIGFDKVFDIALLKIPKKNKDFLVLGRSRDISVGDKIYTIGNPIGIKYTVTSGIISNKEIDFFQLGRAFQIDAAINPGNSGGPLIDERGQVVGIVFAGIPQFEGINFAIPFEWVRKTIPALYKGGEIKRCWIGGGLYEEDKDILFYYVLPNGPAANAGIQKGDKLLKIDGFKVKSVEDAQELLAWRRYPRLIEIEILRKDKTIKLDVKLEERPYLPVETAFKKDIEANLITLIFGIGVEYYGKGIFFNKYKTTKIYRGMYGFHLNIGEGDRIVVYDLKYIEKNKIVKLTLKFKQKDLGFIDRIITVISPIEINSIL